MTDTSSETIVFIFKVNLDSIPQSGSNAEVECANTTIIAQKLLPPVLIQISINSLGPSLCLYALNLGEDNSIVLG